MCKLDDDIERCHQTMSHMWDSSLKNVRVFQEVILIKQIQSTFPYKGDKSTQ